MFGDALEITLAAPFKCPLSKCQENISSSILLSHFLQNHNRDENGVDVKEVQDKEKITLAVTEDFLKMELNVCLGILAYKLEHSNQSNALLSLDHKNLENHLPILIMACRGNYIKMFEDESEFLDPEADFIVIWLVSAENQNLHATIVAHDEELRKSRSTLVKVRCTNDSQNVSDFMQQETNFLVINSGFLKQISNGSIFIEVSIAENLM